MGNGAVAVQATVTVLLCFCTSLALIYFLARRTDLLASHLSWSNGPPSIKPAFTGSRNVSVNGGADTCKCSAQGEGAAGIVVHCMCGDPNRDGCPPNLKRTEIVPTEACSGPPPRVQVVKKVEEVPWYAKNKVWHYPVTFPRCSMDACFNYSRCEAQDDLRIYYYPQPALPARYFSGLNKTRWYTDDPNKACLFFVFLDTPGLYRPEHHPSTLPFWNHGLNHVLVTFADTWRQKGHPPESIENASVMISDMHLTNYRPNFDIGIPLPGYRHSTDLQELGPLDRKYVLTFRGLRYINREMFGEGILRSFDSFRSLHNGRDVIVATSCRHPINDEFRREDPSLGAHCDEDDAVYDLYDFRDLMNTTFGLAPAGIQPNSYRFVEILSAGAIPVLVVDNYVKPFAGMVQWHRCALEFPSSEMHRIMPAVRALGRRELERRQRYCMRIYRRLLSGDEALLRAAIAAQKLRFMGVFPSWLDLSYYDIDLER